MSRRIAFRPAAEDEVREARAWYERRREGLGDELVACIDSCLAGVSASPETFARVVDDIRRAVVRRFPYCVYYVIEADRIVVLAVFHAGRDPVRWTRRC